MKRSWMTFAYFNEIGPAGLSVTKYYRQLHEDVKDKADAGYNKTITDYWGRALSYQLVNASDGGPGVAVPDSVKI